MTAPLTHALSIRQPWAAMIISGHKLIENRSRPTKMRGRIWVHAGLQQDHEGHHYMVEIAKSQGLTETQIREILHKHGRRGGIVGSVEIIDCLSRSSDLWFVGPYGYALANPEPLPFQACKGMLGFFKPDLNPRGSLI